MRKKRRPTSSQAIEQVLKEVCEEYADEETSCEQIKELYTEIFREYAGFFNDDFNIIYIDKFGRFIPRANMIEKLINDEEERLVRMVPDDDRIPEKKERIAKLKQEFRRVESNSRNYRKRGKNK